jgi:beta-lactam-binding protein with PASTA domain
MAPPLVLTACSSGPTASQNAAVSGILSTSKVKTSPAVRATTIPTSSTTTTSGVEVPNVIGQFTSQARVALRDAGLRIKSVNSACARGDLTSESVVQSLELIGPTGTEPLGPGFTVPPKSLIGVTWSGCYGKGVVVPNVVGMAWPDGARAIIVAGGLHWSCTVDPSAPKGPTPRSPGAIAAQSPAAGTNVQTGTVVTLSANVCPGSG